jgi:subfamily B ATP-binding cassette protein MsbA
VNKSNELADISFRIDMASAAVSPITEVLATVVLCSILFVAAPLASSNYTAEFAKLMAFIIMLYRVQPQLKALQTARVIFRSCAQAVEELSDFITQTTSKYMPEGTKKFAKLEQKIQVESVSFAYPSSSGHAIHDINLVIPANRTTALVGPSGAGKTTLANLLVRFYDPSGGTILVDGEDLRSFTLDSWHRNVGIVSQNIYLFDGTVEENIAFGRPDATAAEVIEAAKLSNAHDFIMELPSGYKTELGERGMRLSGGQRQRIALARALLKKPALLILDEATSALDSFSESLVQEALASLKHRQTILVIAHRMSTIQQADSIAVIDEGGLVEVGTPAELRTVDGIYARLCDMQFSAGDPVGVGRDTAI